MWSLGVVLFILLSGKVPFKPDGKDSSILTERMQRNISEGRYSMSGQAWEKVSEVAKDLVRSLMTTDPARRLTSAELNRHPWVLGHEVAVTPLATPGELLTGTEDRAVASRLMAGMLSDMRPEPVIQLADPKELLLRRQVSA
jgi:serine/threonine protein kinase